MGLTIPTLLEKCSKFDRRSQIFKKIRLRRAVGILFSKLNGFDHCWKNAPNPTEDRKSLKNSPAAGSSVYTFLKIKWV
jgi:hypothetical protein